MAFAMQETFAAAARRPPPTPSTGVAAHRQDRYDRRREGHLDDRREHQGRHGGLGGQRRRRREPPQPELRQRRGGHGASPHLARDHGARRQQVRRRRLPRARPERLQGRCWSTCRRSIGLSLDAAKQAIEAAGFVFEDGGAADSNQPAGTVSGTDPGPGRSRQHDPRLHRATATGTTVPDLDRHERAAGEGRARCGRPAHEGRRRQPARAPSPARDPAPNTGAKRGDEVTVTFDDGGNCDRATVEPERAHARCADRHRDRRGGRCRARMGVAGRAHRWTLRDARCAGPPRRRGPRSGCCTCPTCTWRRGSATSRPGSRSLADLQPDLIVDTGDNLGHATRHRGIRRAFDAVRAASPASSCTGRTTTRPRR